jgi:serine/threonine protein phosphatase 1
LLFVSANIDPSRPLAAQGDVLWWGDGPFPTPDDPYEDFARVVRGWDASGGGYQSGRHRTTVESGEPRAVLFDKAGAIQAVIGL